jgi:hypothetical protein
VPIGTVDRVWTAGRVLCAAGTVTASPALREQMFDGTLRPEVALNVADLEVIDRGRYDPYWVGAGSVSYIRAGTSPAWPQARFTDPTTPATPGET